MKNKIIAVIPCHLASIRYPNKILLNLFGLPMIEHVRRRALLSKKLNEVFVATCDTAITKSLKKYKVKTIKTSNLHKNGTTRVAEAVKNINCTHVILLQGDEPLLLPNYIDTLIDKINYNPANYAWNLTAPLTKRSMFTERSMVKCKLNNNKEIISLYRYQKYKDLKNLKKHRKILGILAFRKDFLLKLVSMKETQNELDTFIEQFRIIDNNYTLKSVNVTKSLPSINIKKDEFEVKNFFKKNSKQKNILKKIININEAK